MLKPTIKGMSRVFLLNHTLKDMFNPFPVIKKLLILNQNSSKLRMCIKAVE